MREWAERRKATIELKRSDFCFPFLLDQRAGQRADRAQGRLHS